MRACANYASSKWSLKPNVITNIKSDDVWRLTKNLINQPIDWFLNCLKATNEALINNNFIKIHLRSYRIVK